MKDLHTIQNTILTKLISSSKSLRYSDMRPLNVENDLFNYHLQYLVKQGIVKKLEGYYSLTEYGKRYVVEDYPIDARGNKQSVFKVNVLANLIIVKDGEKYVLNQIRKRQPFYGQHTTVGGNLHKGESIVEGAARNLLEKTGLMASFKLVGNVRRVTLDNNGNVFNDIIFYLCVSDKYEGSLIEENEYGKNFFNTLENTINTLGSKKPFLKSLIKLLTELKTKPVDKLSTFITEEIVDVEEI